MKKKIMKIVKENWILIFATCVLLAILLPIFLLNIYNHPSGDDYANYNMIVSQLSDKSMTFGNIFVASIQRSINTYLTWQGNYFTLLLGIFHPFFISFGAYNFSIFLTQLFYIFGVMFFFLSLPKIKNFINKKQAAILGICYLILSITFMYSLQEGIYWYSSISLYLLPFSISMIFLGFLVRYIAKPTKVLYAILLLLLICLAGTNYVTGLFLGFLLLLLVIYSFLKNKTYFIKSIIALLIFGVGFAFNVFAPGNFARITNFEQVSMIKAMLMTIPLSFYMLHHLFFQTVLLPILVLLTPMIVSVVKKTKTKFEHPILLVLFLLVTFVSFFAPTTYSYGNMYQETRYQNIELFYLILMAMVAYFYLIGYVIKNKAITFLEDKNMKPLFIFTGIIFLVVMISAIGIDKFNFQIASQDILSKKAVEYHECMNNFDNILETSTTDIVTIKNCATYTSSLPSLYLEDNNWVKDSIELYYDKKITIEK